MSRQRGSKNTYSIKRMFEVLDENKRLREALEKIISFGRPLEAPRASYAVCEINDIAKAALEGKE